MRQDLGGVGRREAAVEVDGEVPVVAERLRAAAARETTSAMSRVVASRFIRPEAFIFTAVNPASTCSRTASAIWVGSSPPTQV